MTTLDLLRLSESLTAPQFEQLLRLRLATAIKQLPRGHSIMLFAGGTYSGEMALHHCDWKIGDLSKDQTSGEILDDCVVEHLRRLNFNKTNKLNLIEGTSSDVEILPLNDEIPA
jgi:hypothetical protein